MDNSHLLRIFEYFPTLDESQKEDLAKLEELYIFWNEKINVISRKDIQDLYLKHVLHSLAIAKFIQFSPGTIIVDIGTGGGFPGIPLSILFRDSEFILIDSINKKVKVAQEIIQSLNLKNVITQNIRVENLKEKPHFYLSRAVAQFSEIYGWTHKKLNTKDQFNPLQNGLICLKGGDLTAELSDYPTATVTPISDYFEEDFFETKSIVYLPISPLTSSKL
jgi:16S rRNA (guanine527-N7)-methyltransferase